MGEGIYMYACVCKYICTLNLQIEVVNQLIGDVYIYIYICLYIGVHSKRYTNSIMWLLCDINCKYKVGPLVHNGTRGVMRNRRYAERACRETVRADGLPLSSLILPCIVD